MRRPLLLRVAAILAFATVVYGVWIVHRTVERATASNQSLVHTQQVLTVAEAVLSGVASAEAAARGYVLHANPGDVEAFSRAERESTEQVERLQSLTVDNQEQQQRVATLRQEMADAFIALRGAIERTDAPPTERGRANDVERARIGSVRRTLQAIRIEEERLLAQRNRDDLDAVSRLELLSTLLVLLAAAALASLIYLLSRDAARQKRGADSLRQQNEALEGLVGARLAELSDSNAQLQSIINSAVDGIILIDASGRIEAFNPGAERLFGYPASEAIGRNVTMLMPSPYHEEHDGYLARYLSTGDAKIIGVGREVTGRRRDGSTFPLHLSVGEMTVGGERKFTGMLHDLSRRVALENQLRASEARWRSIIDAAVDGIIVIDGYGRIEAFNPAAERLFGYSEAEICGRNVHMLMPSPYHEEHDTYLARYLATGNRKIIGTGREVTGLRRDGTTFPLHLSVGEMLVGGERRFTGILHDLSARVRIEGQLREQTSLARLGEMAAVIAHEVKNPLAGVRGAISVIGSRLPQGRDSDIVKEIVARIDALNDLMKDLLLFARPPQPHATPVDVTPLVTLVAELLKQDPAAKDMQIEVSGESTRVLADTGMLKIVFQNLLLNATHAMQGKGRVLVAVSTRDAMCTVAFHDDGPGIPADIRDKMFTPFFTTKARGSGLGLATARRLIEAHHGDISIDCPPSGGTTVSVRLPTLPS